MVKNKPLRVSNIRKYIEIYGIVYEVLNKKNDGMKKGFAYVKDGYVYIYGGKKKNEIGFKPGHCYKVDGKLIYISHNDEDKEEYSEERINIFSDSKIIEAINQEEGFKEVDPSVIESSDEFFAPEIIPSDNILKRVVKKVLKEKRINLKSMRDRFKNDYDISNMKGALIKPGPMSMMYFTKWAEILEMEVIISAEFQDGTGEITTVAEKL